MRFLIRMYLLMPLFALAAENECESEVIYSRPHFSLVADCYEDVIRPDSLVTDKVLSRLISAGNITTRFNLSNPSRLLRDPSRDREASRELIDELEKLIAESN
jgi:hypothetical protein